MGWTSTNYGGKVDDFFQNGFLSKDWEFVGKGAFKHLSEYYRAVRNKKTNEVTCLVVLIRYNKNTYYNFSYKEMDETCCPVACSCPKSILKLLTPTDNEMANEWRKACWAKIHNAERAKSLSHGDVIKFNKKFCFDFGECDTFRVYKNRKQTLFVTKRGNYCRIKNWKQYDFTVIQKA